jgi:hypothetical protein
MIRLHVPFFALAMLLGPPAALADNPPQPAEPNATPLPTTSANQGPLPPLPNAAPLPQSTEPPPSAAAAPPAAPAPAVPNGQWVYTGQYGWVWMPYEQAYTQVYPDESVAYMYVYYPAVGWNWMVAPWVLGFGPLPYWGPFGAARFAWYAHPWFRGGVAHPVHGGAPYHGSSRGAFGGSFGRGGFGGHGFGGGGHGHR